MIYRLCKGLVYKKINKLHEELCDPELVFVVYNIILQSEKSKHFIKMLEFSIATTLFYCGYYLESLRSLAQMDQISRISPLYPDYCMMRFWNKFYLGDYQFLEAIRAEINDENFKNELIGKKSIRVQNAMDAITAYLGGKQALSEELFISLLNSTNNTSIKVIYQYQLALISLKNDDVSTMITRFQFVKQYANKIFVRKLAEEQLSKCNP
jgi:hypothetical protein